MSIISKETWDKFTEEEKEKTRKYYSEFVYLAENGIDEEERIVNSHLKVEFEMWLGKENLQPESKIKTWEDIEKEYPEHFGHSNTPNPMLIPSQELRDKLLTKSIATYKIATLIELGYGGMITNEEWRNDEWKYAITCNEGGLLIEKSCHKRMFIAFHTPEQREEFMSYESNRKLVEQYYMI